MQTLARKMPSALLFSCAYFITVTTSTDYTEAMHQLKEDLLHGYDKDVIPKTNVTSPVVVHCSFFLSSVLNFDELAMELTTNGYISMIWQDPRLAWQPSPQNGFAETITIPLSKVWSPVPLLMNQAEALTPITSDWMVVRVAPDGTAILYGGGVFQTLCSVDVKYFPFDVQKCDVNLTPLIYNPSEVRLVSTSDKAGRVAFEENGQWEITETSIAVHEPEGQSSMCTTTLLLKRRPLFFVVNILLPVVCMALLNIFVFLIPPEAVDRLYFCLTVLLAIAVFLTVLGDNIPKTSSPMSLLSYFLLLELSLSVFICIATIINLRVFHTSNTTPIQPWLKALTRAVNGMLLKRKRDDKRMQSDKDMKDEFSELTDQYMHATARREKVTLDTGCPQECFHRNTPHTQDSAASHADQTTDLWSSSDTACRTDNGNRCNNVHTVNHECDNRELQSVEVVTWQDVSRMADKILFLFSFLVLFVSVLVFVFEIIGNMKPAYNMPV